ncbi:MAG: hypothetical protein HY689_11495, partial [Chloroflexi bacterium]|nr:hypothetical protein [Chloroflexota bacterium]
MAADTFASTLRKILQAEARKQYDNSAVVGGLDRYLDQALSQVAGPALTDFPHPAPSYRALDPDGRRHWVTLVTAWLDHRPDPPSEAVRRAAGHTPAAGRTVTVAGPPPSAEGQPAGPPPGPPSSAPRGRGRRSRATTGAGTDVPSPDPQAGPTPTPPPREPRPAPPRGAATRPGPGGEITPDAPVRYLPGVGKEYAEKLARLGAQSVRDLLFLFPRRHVDYSRRVPIAHLQPGLEQTVIGVLWQATEKRLGSRPGTEALIGDDTGNLRVVWYNQPHIARTLGARGQAPIAVSGRVTLFHGRPVLESPEYEVLDREDEDRIHTGRLVPVYPGTEGISPRTIRRSVKTALDRAADRMPD